MAKIPTLKSSKKYKDAPRYPLIYDYEGKFRKNYRKMIGDMSLEIAKKLKGFNEVK